MYQYTKLLSTIFIGKEEYGVISNETYIHVKLHNIKSVNLCVYDIDTCRWIKEQTDRNSPLVTVLLFQNPEEEATQHSAELCLPLLL
jgi:hypothetical protein